MFHKNKKLVWSIVTRKSCHGGTSREMAYL